MESQTPLKDIWQKRIARINQSAKFTDFSKLEIGDYVLVKNSSGNLYSGFLKKKGRVNLIIETPYGGFADNDYMQIVEISFKCTNLVEFLKPKKRTKEDYMQISAHGYSYYFMDAKGVYYSRKNPAGPGYHEIKFKPEDFDNGNFEYMCEHGLSNK